jgi:hypothetical protein
MLTGNFIAAAREWIGTPYERGASRKGAGVGCDGLVAAVFGASDFGALLDGLEHVPHVRLAQAGDVVALKEVSLAQSDNTPRHLMVLTETAPRWKGIHASASGVCEVELNSGLLKAIHSIWRLKSDGLDT